MITRIRLEGIAWDFLGFSILTNFSFGLFHGPVLIVLSQLLLFPKLIFFGYIILSPLMVHIPTTSALSIV